MPQALIVKGARLTGSTGIRLGNIDIAYHYPVPVELEIIIQNKFGTFFNVDHPVKNKEPSILAEEAADIDFSETAEY